MPITRKFGNDTKVKKKKPVKCSHIPISLTLLHFCIFFKLFF